jgi:hypothetical protein
MIPNFDCPVGTTRDERLGMEVIPFHGINCHVMSLYTKYISSMKENKVKIKKKHWKLRNSSSTTDLKSCQKLA